MIKKAKPYTPPYAHLRDAKGAVTRLDGEKKGLFLLYYQYPHCGKWVYSHEPMTDERIRNTVVVPDKCNNCGEEAAVLVD